MSSTHEESSTADRHPWSTGQARYLMPMRCNTQLRGVTVSHCSGTYPSSSTQFGSLLCTNCAVLLFALLSFMAPAPPCLLLFCPSRPPSPTARRLGQRVPSRMQCAFHYLTTYIKSFVITKGLRVHLVETDFIPANPNPKYFKADFKLQLTP